MLTGEILAVLRAGWKCRREGEENVRAAWNMGSRNVLVPVSVMKEICMKNIHMYGFSMVKIIKI